MFYAEGFKNRGFAIIELIVVVAIIVALLGIVLLNFPKTKDQVSLSRVANKFAQDVRRSQILSVSNPANSSSYSGGNPSTGYGVYVDVSSGSNKKYIIYLDNVNLIQYYNGSNAIIETYDFSSLEPAIFIKQLNNVVGNTVSIDSPYPRVGTIITPTPTQDTVEVVFALSSDATITKTVSVSKRGLVEVK